MIHVIFRSLAVTLLVVVVGHTVSYATRLHLGYGYPGFVVAMNTLVPFVTAFPVALYIFRQQARLRLLYEELRQAHDRLAEESARDGLTGLMSREPFFDEMAAVRSNRATGALMIIDADHFKAINDHFGHLTGDRALKLLSGAIACSVRDNDLVGRIGGEEFAVYLPATGANDAVEIAERVRRTVEGVSFEPVPGVRHKLTVSIGIARATAARTRGVVFASADACLYEAKERGRNTVVCEAREPEAGNVARLHERRAARRTQRG